MSWARRAWTLPATFRFHQTRRDTFDRTRVRAAEAAGCEVIRLFIVAFIDGFGLFRRASHSTDGFYATLGNFDRRDRHNLENIWCLGMKPPGTDLRDCMKPFLVEIKDLQRGYYLQLEGEVKPVFVIGSLGLFIADMPQANALAGCQHQSSGHPCRRCNVEKGASLGDANFDVESTVRTPKTIADVRAESGLGNGIGAASPLEDLAWFDTGRGIPTEPMHSEQGLNRTLVGLLLKSLTAKYLKKLSREVSTGLLAKQWPWKIPRFKLSKEGKVNLTFTQTSRFIQMCPFILVRAVQTIQGVTQQDWLKPNMLRRSRSLN